MSIRFAPDSIPFFPGVLFDRMHVFLADVTYRCLPSPRRSAHVLGQGFTMAKCQLIAYPAAATAPAATCSITSSARSQPARSTS